MSKTTLKQKRKERLNTILGGARCGLYKHRHDTERKDMDLLLTWLVNRVDELERRLGEAEDTLQRCWKRPEENLPLGATTVKREVKQ